MPLARSAAASAAASTESSKSIVPTTSERFAGSATKGVAKSRRLGPAVEVRRGGVGALDAPVEAAAAEHPLDLVGEQDQGRQRRACCRSAPCASSRARSAARGRRAASGRRRRRAPRSGRSRPGSAAPARGRRRRRRPSAGRSSRRRPGEASSGRPPAPEVASIRTRRVAGAVGAADVDHHAGRGLVVGPGDRRRRRGRRPASGASPGSASTTIGSARNGAAAVALANFCENSP